ncbi:hypothetical protein JCM33774_26620 [Actinophytocola sp. KF-1]
MVLRAGVADRPPGREVVVAVGLVADRAKSASTEYTVGHGDVLSFGSQLPAGARVVLTKSNVRVGRNVPARHSQLLRVTCGNPCFYSFHRREVP